jgi:FkbM family methyltransferase
MILRLTRLVPFVLITLAALPALAQDGDAGRDKNEKVAEVLAALEVATASRVADIGAGDGFFSVRIARALPASGRVMAVDVTDKSLEQLRQRLAREQVANVDVTLGAFDDPRLAPNTFDSALIYNAYHEMTEFAPMLKGILAALKPGGRLVIIERLDDSMRAESRATQTAKHQISEDITASELEAAGFRIVRKDAAFRPFISSTGTGAGAWWLIVATKPAP